MAAAGGDTIIPTNWTGTIVTIVFVAIVAAVTYFGMEFKFGDAEGGATKVEESTSVQDVFSASARRELAAAETGRALSRADFSAPEEMDTDNDTSAAQVAASRIEDTDEDVSSDWESSDSSDWDTDSETAAAEAAPEPTPAPAPASTPTPTAKPAVNASNETTSTSSTNSTVAAQPIATRKRPSAEALTAWWKDASNNSLSVTFAGTLDRGDRASDGVAVIFNTPVAAEQAAQHLELKSATGKVIAAKWKPAGNPAMLMAVGLAEGRYELTIGSGLQAMDGKSLNSTVSGPVFVY